MIGLIWGSAGQCLRQWEMPMPYPDYPVLIEPLSVEDGGGYLATVPDLPGCIAAGSTRGEAEALIRESIAFHMEGLRLEGLPVPEPTSEALAIAVA